ncbi:hypothetical protein BDY21DRAFT_347703 [Lineolata rhizophorae]|uniref:Uncharacterized protein n=1 Tax=Lineolata rhizophorae TaxID=578093 RepID=A0A6A6NWA5_9PEZI|nr:hypothetical protein BDY21DRAFT_347703 [Lineolata rhizophorae]
MASGPLTRVRDFFLGPLTAQTNDSEPEPSEPSSPTSEFVIIQWLPSTQYSQDVTVRAISSYYNFLSTILFDLQPEEIDWPPPSGWPQITEEDGAYLNKNKTVIELLRHLPYFRQPQGDPFVWMQDTPVLCYQQGVGYADDHERTLFVDPYESEVPPHVVSLAHGLVDAYYVMLDTERGVIYWDGCREMPGTELTSTEVVEKRHKWKTYSTFLVEDFFEMLKQKFRDLKWIAVNPTDIREIDYGSQIDEEYNHMRKALQDAGWPGDGEGGGWDRDAAAKKFSEIEEEFDGPIS